MCKAKCQFSALFCTKMISNNFADINPRGNSCEKRYRITNWELMNE